MQDRIPLRKRIAPSVPLTIELQDADGSKFVMNFRLSFDVNAFAAFTAKTGHNLLSGEAWLHSSDPQILRAMLWAAVLLNHPEYDSDEGLEVIGSYISVGDPGPILEKIFDAYVIQLSPEKQRVMREAKERALRGENPIQANAEPTPVPA